MLNPQQMQEGAHRYLNIPNFGCYRRDHSLLSKFCVCPEGQILAKKYGNELKKHFCLGFIGTKDEEIRILKKQILIVLKMVSGIKLKSRKEISQIK